MEARDTSSVGPSDPSGYVAETLTMLRRARDTAQDALDRRRDLGDEDENPPPARAVRVLDELIRAISAGQVEPRGGGLGLSRGAGDFEWLLEEEPLLRLLSDLDRWWIAHGKGREVARPPHSLDLKIRHVTRSPPPGRRPAAEPD